MILLALASCAGLVKFNYDDRKNLPADAASNRGTRPWTRTSRSQHIQQFIIIQSPRQTCAPRSRWPIWSRWPSG